MAINFDNMGAIYINDKQVKTLYVNDKQVRLSYVIKYNLNILESGTNYYVSGQSWAIAPTTPADSYVVAGSAIGTLPSVGNHTYNLSSVSYTIYVIGWYSDAACTTQVTTSTVPTGDMTLYAKWKMTANVAISASITVPKFATSVSWTCYSNGGSRSAVSRTISSSATRTSVGLVMAASGAARNSDSYTWTGAIGGKALTLASQSLTLNGVTRSVSTPAAGATAGGTIVLETSITKSRAGSVTVFNSNNLKCVVSWPALGSTAKDVTATFSQGGSSKGSYVIAKGKWDDGFGVSDDMSTRSTTFASGVTGGAAGGYGVTRCRLASNSYTVSIAAASGTGYSRTVSVNA